MPTLAVNNFNIVVSVLGGWVSLFGLVSYLCKENFYLSEARMGFSLSLSLSVCLICGANDDLLTGSNKSSPC